MDVSEVIGLADWMQEHVRPAMPVYEDLVAAMEQNANNGSKVPLREHLESVHKVLVDMPVSQLSYQQTDLLDSMEVTGLIGPRGWQFVERTVKEGNYDPASAATDLRKAKQHFEQSLRQFSQAHEVLTGAGIAAIPQHPSPDTAIVRVRFKGAVAIENVVQLKKWSSEWYDIARGLAVAAGERPEDVEVKGATTGSLILVLGTSLMVAKIIALIMKQVASTVKSSMEIAHTLQDWKMRKVADAEVERVLTARRKSVEASGVQVALDTVKNEIGQQVSGDTENALKKSIEKMFSFSAKGGEVDLLPPPVPEDGEGFDEATVEAISAITDNIEEMRTLKAATQLLIEDKANETTDDMDEPDVQTE